MALDTYANLQTAIAGWLHHETLAAAQIQEFIRLAEERMTADLASCPFLQQTPSVISLTPPASTFTLAADASTLITARLVELDSPLDIVPADQLKAMSIVSTGVPCACAITGGTDAGLLTVTVWPPPSSAHTVRVTYAAAVPALSDSRTTNFILARAPSLYLYGSLLAGEAWGVNDPRAPMWQTMYDAALARFRGLGWDGDVMLATDLPIRGGSYDIYRGY
jgi:hypothetical protein